MEHLKKNNISNTKTNLKITTNSLQSEMETLVQKKKIQRVLPIQA